MDADKILRQKLADSLAVSDATLIIAREPWSDNVSNDCSECAEELTGGTKCTADYCKKHGKPYFVIFKAAVYKPYNWTCTYV